MNVPIATDAIVIGTGQAGPSLAAALAGSGLQVAVIERHRFGGTCVNVGCIPTKTSWRARARRMSLIEPETSVSRSAARSPLT